MQQTTNEKEVNSKEEAPKELVLTKEQEKRYLERLAMARFRLLNSNPFFGLLLMYTRFKLDTKCETAYTNGEIIAFDPKFMDRLSNKEIDFILMHEVMHIVLQHVKRGRNYNHDLFNVACDIVVNSNIMHSNNDDLSSITLKEGGVSMHLVPDGTEGYLYTAEEVYNLILEDIKENPKEYIIVDSHDGWDEMTDEEFDVWLDRIVNAANMVSNKPGSVPVGARIQIDELLNPKLDWKEILRDFLAYDIYDYSFTKPDIRFNSYDFFMPGFNAEDKSLNLKVLFAVDTSGSMDKKALTEVFTEIKSVIDDGNGNIRGMIGFFDCNFYNLSYFDSYSDIENIEIRGGGGTSFDVIFDQLSDVERTLGEKPDLIIVLTDGYADFPPVEKTNNIPVLWIINSGVNPPYGTVARL